jgi:type II secretory pathway pseudopilin PulG
VPEDSFAAKNGRLIALVRRARQAGDERAAARALEELLDAYRRLGARLAGTPDEQNTYIVARRLGSLPKALVELGVTAEDLPMPPARRYSPPPAAAAAEDPRVLQHFAHLREDGAETDRFHVVHRPQDNMRYHGRLLPFAVVDREDGMPVAWYDNREWAEHIATVASTLRDAD